MKNIFACIAVIMGAIIGAGFASGKEILNFFNIYGNKGILGIIVASLIFGLVVVLVCNITKRNNVHEYRELINNNKFISFILQVFSAVCFCIMISGIGVFFEQQLNINFWYGTAFAASISYAMFLHKFKGLEIFSLSIVPLIILGMFILGFSNYEGIELSENFNSMALQASYGNWLISGVLYASYNSLILIPILINFRKYNLKNKDIYLIGVLTSVILFILIMILYRINNLFYPKIMSVELPNMLLASLLSKKIEILYGAVMIISIFTTAFSCGFNFLEMRSKKNYERNALLMCVIAFLCAKIGFSNLINICFPIFRVFRNFSNFINNIYRM